MLLGRAVPHKRGDQQNAIQRGDNKANPRGSKPRVLLEPVPIVPKKDGGMRPVINLKSLNEYVVPQHFKMEGIHTLKDLLRRSDWMTKIDLKDAYFTIPIHSTSRFLDPRATAPLRVLLPAIRPVVCSMGFYQDPEAGTNPTQRVGDKTSGIHRQYTRLDGDGGDREESYLSVNIPAGKPGLHNTPSKNRDNPIPGDRIPGNDGGFQSNGITAAGSEVEKTSFRSCKDHYQGSVMAFFVPPQNCPTGQKFADIFCPRTKYV